MATKEDPVTTSSHGHTGSTLTYRAVFPEGDLRAD